MPCTSNRVVVIAVSTLLIMKEAGPEIFVHCHRVMVPSGSVELLPFNKILSNGNVMVMSGPAAAIGGLLSITLSRQFSQEYSFLQEIKVLTPISRKRNPFNSFCFISMVLLRDVLTGSRKDCLFEFTKIFWVKYLKLWLTKIRWQDSSRKHHCGDNIVCR